jgi:hypothetical protein
MLSCFFLNFVLCNREKAGTAKAATNGKTMTITTPNNLVAKLAAKLKGTTDTPSETIIEPFLLSGVLILLLRYEIENNNKLRLALQ